MWKLLGFSSRNVLFVYRGRHQRNDPNSRQASAFSEYFRTTPVIIQRSLQFKKTSWTSRTTDSQPDAGWAKEWSSLQLWVAKYQDRSAHIEVGKEIKKNPLICCSQRARPYYYATGSISPPAGRLGRVGKRFFRGLALMIKYVRPFLDLFPARLPQDLRSCRRTIDEEPLAS